MHSSRRISGTLVFSDGTALQSPWGLASSPPQPPTTGGDDLELSLGSCFALSPERRRSHVAACEPAQMQSSRFARPGGGSPPPRQGSLSPATHAAVSEESPFALLTGDALRSVLHALSLSDLPLLGGSCHGLWGACKGFAAWRWRRARKLARHAREMGSDRLAAALFAEEGLCTECVAWALHHVARVNSIRMACVMAPHCAPEALAQASERRATTRDAAVDA